MEKKTIKIVTGVVAVILLTAIDQFTKALAVSSLKGKEPFVLIDGVLEFLYVMNNGAAWGMLSGARSFFIILTIVILVALIYIYMKTPWNRKYAPLVGVEILGFAGAAGNFIDRCQNGYVHDFIYFKLIDFPVFNIADCYVVLAGIFLVVLVLFVYKDDHDFEFLTKKEQNQKREDRTSGN